MRLFRSIAAGILTLAFATSARASGVIPADHNAGKIPNITVWDEANHEGQLRTKLAGAGSGPVFVLPVYTHCTMSCPVLAARLVHETAQLAPGAVFRVLIFSFDSSDDAASLRAFRAEQKLPASWILVRSTDVDIRQFTDFFHYRVLTEGPVMLHSNQLFLFDHHLVWKATFLNEDWIAADIRTWLRRVEVPGLLGWLVMNPQKLAFIGFCGMLLALDLVLWAVISRSQLSVRNRPSQVVAKER
jgi:cytochrome oxidase Cu insertion factor (SCO1/SenC/PrrC family)